MLQQFKHELSGFTSILLSNHHIVSFSQMCKKIPVILPKYFPCFTINIIVQVLRSQHVVLGSQLYPARFGYWDILCKLQSNNKMPHTTVQLKASNKVGTLVSIC